MNKTPDILHVVPGRGYTEEIAQLFGSVACGELDAFGFAYGPGENQQFVPIFTEAQEQSERSFAWLGTRVTRSFVRDAENRVRQVRKEAGLDHQGPLEFIGKLTREQANDYAEQIRLVIAQDTTAQAIQPENGLIG